MRKKQTVLFLLTLIVALPLFTGGTCGMRYETFAETRRQFIAMSWILGDWRHNSNTSLPIMRWENREPDQYVGTFPCLKFQTDSTHKESIPVSDAPLCEYQFTRQDGNIKFDIAARPPSGNLRFLYLQKAFESISYESLRELRETNANALEFRDSTSTQWNSVRLILQSHDTLLISTGTLKEKFEKFDTLIRVK